MSAIVLGKRSNSIFEELHHHSPSQSPFDTPVSKRIRCSSSPTHIRFSPPRPSSQSPRGLNGGGIVVDSAYSAHLDHLRSLFPDMDQKVMDFCLLAFVVLLSIAWLCNSILLFSWFSIDLIQCLLCLIKAMSFGFVFKVFKCRILFSNSSAICYVLV